MSTNTGTCWGVESRGRLIRNPMTGLPYAYRTREEARLVAGARASQGSFVFVNAKVVKFWWSAHVEIKENTDL